MREWVTIAEMVQDSIADELDSRRAEYHRAPPRLQRFRSTVSRMLLRAGRIIAPPMHIPAAGAFMEDACRTSKT